jgi:hypothetical protein
MLRAPSPPSRRSAPEAKQPKHIVKEPIMNTFVSALYREVTCGAAAILITLVLGAAFVRSTSVAPGQAGSGRVLALQTTHGWFGQPEPAVLVD